MNIFLDLFLTFSKIGLFTFGGVYAMIAISESTPGPITINLATYIGSSQAGFLGVAIATFAVVSPSFLIILSAILGIIVF